MTGQDRPEFVKGLLVLGEVFNEPISELRGEAYFDALADLELGAVLFAIKQAVKACTFFPKPAELRRLVHGNAEDRAELAWVEAQRFVRKIGSYRSPTFDDPAMKAAIDALGGWRAFCLSEDEPTYRATVFKRTFAAMTRRVEADRLFIAGVDPAGLLDSGEESSS